MNDVPTKSWDLAFVQSASRYAEDAHAGDIRKGSGIPYLSHLWSVAAIVMENGGTDRQVAAALLHDVVEDHGGQPRLDDVRDRFGDDVADMVAALSDSIVDTTTGAEKPPWKDRKMAYLERLRKVEEKTLLVSASDKLHNLRSIVSDYRTIGPDFWGRFSQADPLAQRCADRLHHAAAGRHGAQLRLCGALQDVHQHPGLGHGAADH